MVTIVLYQCPNCNFQIQLLSGGYQATYRPMVCGTCGQLVNVLTELSPALRRLADESLQDRLNRCPVCQSAQLEPWDDVSAPCPRCGTPMEWESGPSVNPTA